MFLTLALLLLPWAAWLSWTLPRRHVFEHWAVAWTGFDLMLAGALVATAVGGFRRAPWVAIAASVAATFLLCDAWFDVLTAVPGDQLAASIVEAVLVELPLAILCMRIAVNAERTLAQAARTARRVRAMAGRGARDGG